MREIEQAKTDDDRKELRQRPDLRIEALGSGSDYTAFLDHIGIASLNLGYGGEGNAGIYHSAYDDFYWYTHFADTDFVYGRALSQTAGTAVLRLANADLLPFEFTDLADTIRLYQKQLKKLADDERGELIDVTRKSRKAFSPPPMIRAVPNCLRRMQTFRPFSNFAPLDNAADVLTHSADRYQAALKKAWPAGVSAATLVDLNQKLMESERRLTTPEGLLRRPWYKHMLYAPGVYSGYGVKTLPEFAKPSKRNIGPRLIPKSCESRMSWMARLL